MAGIQRGSKSVTEVGENGRGTAWSSDLTLKTQQLHPFVSALRHNNAHPFSYVLRVTGSFLTVIPPTLFHLRKHLED